MSTDVSLSHPLVTIGLSIYNAESTLVSAVQSIVAQTYQEWELLLIDDGSHDASYKIARDFKDKRIVAVSDGQNKGLSARLNQAVKMARGKYFCRMDQDDVAFPNRLEKQVEFLERHPDVDLVASSVVVFRSDGSLAGVVQIPENHQEICKHPWHGFYLPHPTWMGQIAWFLAHPYSSKADGAEDQFLLYGTYRKSHFSGIPEVLLGYRENRRSFKKMFSKRMIFWRAVAEHAIQHGQWGDLLLLCMTQPVKIAGDFFNTILGVARTRSRLGAVRPLTEAVWLDLWRRVNRHGTGSVA
jgi:glycosyltransferase involved in cell wall biosynthesis